MNYRAIGVLLLMVVAATVSVLSGCAGDRARFAEPIDTDGIIGHWVAGQQSTALTGARSATTIVGNVSFVVTQSGMRTWSGTVTGTSGARLSPAGGAWLRTGDSYSLTNTASQNGSFGWSGSELFSTTRRGGETIYLWWTKS